MCKDGLLAFSCGAAGLRLSVDSAIGGRRWCFSAGTLTLVCYDTHDRWTPGGSSWTSTASPPRTDLF